MYSNDNNSEKQILKLKHTGVTKLKDDEESEKYIKEMHELADKNEFKNNLVVLGLGIVIVSIIVFSILMNTSFMKPKTDVASNETVTKTTNDSTHLKLRLADPILITSTKIYEYLNVEANRTSFLKKQLN